MSSFLSFPMNKLPHEIFYELRDIQLFDELVREVRFEVTSREPEKATTANTHLIRTAAVSYH